MKNHKTKVILTPIGDGYVRLDLATGRIQILARPASFPSRSVSSGSGSRNALEDKAKEFRIQLTS